MKDQILARVFGEDNISHPQTVIRWETLFSKIANTVDNLPITKGNRSNATNLGYEIITSNRLKLGQIIIVHWKVKGLNLICPQI